MKAAWRIVLGSTDWLLPSHRLRFVMPSGATPPALTAADLSELARIDDPLRRRLSVAAALSARLSPASLVATPIVVGGGAVEFYTTGGYSTQDIDLVVIDRRPAEDLLSRSGFIKRDRYWNHPDLDALIEFPGQTLTYGDRGAYDRVIEVELAPGRVALVIGIEDILIDRLFTAVTGKRANDLKWAREMAALHRDQIDWAAVAELARANGADLVSQAEAIRAEVDARP